MREKKEIKCEKNDIQNKNKIEFRVKSMNAFSVSIKDSRYVNKSLTKKLAKITQCERHCKNSVSSKKLRRTVDINTEYTWLLKLT